MSLPTREQIANVLESTLVSMAKEGRSPSVEAPIEIKDQLDALVTRGHKTVRDGVLTLLAMEVAHGELIDWRHQPLHNPARSASRFLGSTLYPRLHIAGSPEALQTGVKGTGTYMDRSNETWKAILGWASDQGDLAQVEAAFVYLASKIAGTARDLPDLPELDSPRLTFGRVFALADSMLDRPSGGAHEQLLFAALLDAWRQQIALPGFVETKHVNAADAAAGTAADVQVKQGGELQEAYEISAESFERKLAQGLSTLKRYDLRRVHIVGKGASEATGGEIKDLIPKEADVSVLDTREEIRSLIARLDKPHRRQALEALYKLLVDKQPDDTLVKEYVNSLHKAGVTLDV